MQQRPSSAGRRPLSRREYEALMRRRRQNRVAIAIMAGIAVLIVAAVVLILRPKPAPDHVAVMAATSAPGGDPTEIPGARAAEPSGGIDLAEATGTSPESGGEQQPSGGEPEAPTALPTQAPELPEAIEEVSSTPRPAGSRRSVRMRVVGDIMFCQSQLVFARDSGYDFHNQFELITDLLGNADYTMGNMEGTIGKYKSSNYSGYPQFNAPDVALAPLKDAGIDFLTLANNHMLDRWVDGLKNTVNWVEQYGFDHVGAYRSKEERNTPVI